MEIRRFITAEHADGSVSVRRDVPLPDTDETKGAKVLWGWDVLPELPIRPDDVPPGLDRPTLFPPSGGANVAVMVLPPAGGPRGTERVDLTHANVDADLDDPLVHRTDTVDLIFVLDGEITLEQPGEDADLDLRRGDFVVQNGGRHKWVNRSARNTVLAIVLLTAPRTG
jgi:hypothetical protein